MKITLSDKEVIKIMEEKFTTLMFEGYKIDEIYRKYSDEWEIKITKTEPEINEEV